ncbi:MAG: peptidoglycan DD-metalloendopeptidase family protein [Bacteroidales bacterium]|nr:peptidoglycan DD-metalloendopeptidase family protein [Bacteroidales bacterium]
MTKTKYKFSPETLEYIEIKQSQSTIIKMILIFFIASIILSVGYFAIFLNIYDTPEEKALRRENKELIEVYHRLNNKILEISNEFDLIEERDENIYRAIFDVNPLQIRNGGTGGSNKYSNYKNLKNKNLVINTAQRIDNLSEKMKIEEKSLADLEKLAFSKQKELLHTPAIQPVENKDLLRTGSGFGMRHHPILNIYRPHEGLDFICPKGSEIYATADGKVSSVRRSTTFGRVIEIKHGFGYLSLYGHLSAFNVKQNQKVKRGDIIGYVGNSGLSSGNHLHYEIHIKGKAVNPIPYFFNDLSPDEFVTMRIIADSIKQSMD